MLETMQFGPLTIQFDQDVLRPRRWTLAQSDWGSELAQTAGDGNLLELCAGVGQIGLAMAKSCADQQRPRPLVLVDADPHACQLAETNAALAQLPLPVEVRNGPLEDALRPNERFAIILADPPWVPSDQTSQFPEDPLSAIDGGSDGLGLARACVEVMASHLAAGGSGILQLGTVQQATAIHDHVEANPSLGLTPGEIRDVSGANGVLLHLVRDKE